MSSVTRLKFGLYYVMTNIYTKFQVNISKGGREKSGKPKYDRRTDGQIDWQTASKLRVPRQYIGLIYSTPLSSDKRLLFSQYNMPLFTPRWMQQAHKNAQTFDISHWIQTSILKVLLKKYKSPTGPNKFFKRHYSYKSRSKGPKWYPISIMSIQINPEIWKTKF